MAAYVPMGNHNDKGASQQDQAMINSLKQQYEQAKAQGAEQSRLDSLHQQAEAIRGQYGYSGGVDGSQEIYLGTTAPTKDAIRSATSQEDNISQRLRGSQSAIRCSAWPVDRCRKFSLTSITET